MKVQENADGERSSLDGLETPLSLLAVEVSGLVEDVRAAGGTPIAAYREPLSGRPLVLAGLPLSAVVPTPFQRDLSPSHTRRLARKIEASGLFLDPLIVVPGADGRFWTPNGRHRLAAARVLGLRRVTALLSADGDLAFKVLTLNTERVHDLRDRSLEAIRMARELAARRTGTKEAEFAAEFETPEFLTLGVVYEEDRRFAGGAYRVFLGKVDRFSSGSLASSLREREVLAAKLREIDAGVQRIVREFRRRGIKSPYIRNYVVSRIDPLPSGRRRVKDGETPMTLRAALESMARAAKEFDVAAVNLTELAGGILNRLGGSTA